jgi:hypothetical protein
MKRMLLALVIIGSIAVLGGCCTDDICNIGSTYVPASTTAGKNCNNCSTCSACGYDTSYTYSGWY